MAKPFFKLHFDENGILVDVTEKATILKALFNSSNNATELWFFSHGWNNDESRADETYDNWTTTLQEQMNRTPALNPQPILVGIYWPSLAWADKVERVTTAGGTAVVNPPVARSELDMEFGVGGYLGGDIPAGENDHELGTKETTKPSTPSKNENDRVNFIKQYRPVFALGSINEARFEADFSRLYELIFETTSPVTSEINEFTELLDRYKIPDPDADPFEKGSILGTSETVASQLKASFSSTGEGYDEFKSFLSAFRTFTFWCMKGRAGTVGQTGVAAFLHEVKAVAVEKNHTFKIHLFGHSFGAKLLSAAVNKLGSYPDLTSPVVDSLVLVLGAFSQYSFSREIPGGGTGHYARVIDQRLVHNPILAIYSRYDLANKEMYPLGMRLARAEQRYELGGPDDKFGAIGANGAQGLTEAQGMGIELRNIDYTYPLEQYKTLACLNVDGHRFIKANKGKRPTGSHGDTNRPEIFHLALSMSRYENN